MTTEPISKTDDAILDQQTALAKQIFGDIVEAVTAYDEPQGFGAGVSLIPPADKDASTEDGITILFTNGRKVRISTSEWTNIQVDQE